MGKDEYKQAVQEMTDKMGEIRNWELFDGALEKTEQILREVLAEQEQAAGREILCGLLGRVKQPESIVKKLIRKEIPVTFENAVNRLNDIVGVRLTCYYLDDVCALGERLKLHGEVHVVKQKDYVEKPKSSGYRSLHLIVEVPVTAGGSSHLVKAEIQIRTMVMDMWARLDHRLCYKKEEKAVSAVAKDLKEYAKIAEKVDVQMMCIRRKIDAMERQ